MSHVRTKICGICSVADAHAAVAAGADALGLVFAQNSRRRLTAADAREISQAIGPFVTRVGLFMDDDASMIEDTLDSVALDMLQFHGDESAAFCSRFDRPYMKAVAMGDGDATPATVAQTHARASAVLLDGNRAGQPGGSGETFDWGVDLSAIDRPVVVAGGLNPANVGQAITALHPYAVDVSSGVEDSPGRKSSAKMQAFVNAVQKAGQS